MRIGFRALALTAVVAWLFFQLYMSAVAISLSRMGAPTAQVLPSLAMGMAGLLGSLVVGLARLPKLSAAAKVVIELLLLLVAIFFLLVVMASRSG